MTSRFNQPAIVALTGLMFRNPGWNSSFVYGQIFQTICPLNLTILSFHQQLKHRLSRRLKCPFWLAQVYSGGFSIRIHGKVWGLKSVQKKFKKTLWPAL